MDMGCVGLRWVALGWVALGCVALHWVGLGWTGSKVEVTEMIRWGLRAGLL